MNKKELEELNLKDLSEGYEFKIANWKVDAKLFDEMGVSIETLLRLQRLTGIPPQTILLIAKETRPLK